MIRLELSLAWYKPKYPWYATAEARMGLFKNWPADLRQQPSALSNAGFYYTGKRGSA